MARQITVRLTDEIDEALSRASRSLNRTPSEIVRSALQRFLARTPTDPHPAERVADLIGSLDSGIPDLAERHREYILESLRNAD
jgi:Arc/MetJ-type ribon-helix-helix transcriptional regulator